MRALSGMCKARRHLSSGEGVVGEKSTNLFNFTKRSEKWLKILLPYVVGKVPEEQAGRGTDKINVLIVLGCCLGCIVIISGVLGPDVLDDRVAGFIVIVTW